MDILLEILNQMKSTGVLTEDFMVGWTKGSGGLQIGSTHLHTKFKASFQIQSLT